MTKNMLSIALSLLIFCALSLTISNVSYAKRTRSQKISRSAFHTYTNHYKIGTRFVTKTYNIIDGSSIQTNDQPFKKILLWGIQAPAYYQTCEDKRNKHIIYCGKNATKALMKFTKGQAITCVVSGTDQFGQVLAECQNINDDNINTLMTTSGNALAQTDITQEFLYAEISAKRANVGIWSTIFVRPNTYLANIKKLHKDLAEYMRQKKKERLLKDSKDKKKGFNDNSNTDIFGITGDHSNYSNNLNDTNFNDHF